MAAVSVSTFCAAIAAPSGASPHSFSAARSVQCRSVRQHAHLVIRAEELTPAAAPPAAKPTIGPPRGSIVSASGIDRRMLLYISWDIQRGVHVQRTISQIETDSYHPSRVRGMNI